MNGSKFKYKKRSPIWKIEKDKLQNLFDTSFSIKEILQKVDIRPHSHNYDYINKIVEDLNISTDKFKINQKIKKSEFLENVRSKRKIEDIFCENSECGQRTVKNYILKNKVIPYKCSKCDNEGVWLNEPISLQLDHINGMHDDNRIENLRFLCPNCHTQTDTFGTKRFKIKAYCKLCNSEKPNSGSIICRRCVVKRKKFTVDREVLERMIYIEMMPFTKIGKHFNVSDNAIRKRCKSLGIDIPTNRIKV